MKPLVLALVQRQVRVEPAAMLEPVKVKITPTLMGEVVTAPVEMVARYQMRVKILGAVELAQVLAMDKVAEMESGVVEET